MKSDETSPAKESNEMLKIFLANTKSAKGKATELQFFTTDSDMSKTVFHHDRNICGGGVMFVVFDQSNSKLVDLSKY